MSLDCLFVFIIQQKDKFYTIEHSFWVGGDTRWTAVSSNTASILQSFSYIQVNRMSFGWKHLHSSFRSSVLGTSLFWSKKQELGVQVHVLPHFRGGFVLRISQKLSRVTCNSMTSLKAALQMQIAPSLPHLVSADNSLPLKNSLLPLRVFCSLQQTPTHWYQSALQSATIPLKAPVIQLKLPVSPGLLKMGELWAITTACDYYSHVPKSKYLFPQVQKQETERCFLY